MLWYEYPLLVLAFALATSVAWVGGFAAADLIDAGPLAEAADGTHLLVMAAPFALLGWLVGRVGFDRPMLYIALAALPLALALVGVGAAIGWGWNAPNAGAADRAIDVLVFSGLGALWAAYVLGSGVGCAWAGVWLSHNTGRKAS